MKDRGRKANIFLGELRISTGDRIFKAIFDLAAVGMACVDPKSTLFTRANKRMTDITGFSLEELKKMSFSDITFVGDRNVDKHLYNRLIDDEISNYVTEKRYVRKDGKIIWVALDVAVIRDETGQALQTVGIIQDITARREAEERLRESENRYRVLTELSPDIILVESEGIIVFANTSTERLLGLKTKESIIGQRLSAIIEPGPHEVFTKRLLSSDSVQESPILFDSKISRVDGTTLDVSLAFSRIQYRGLPAIEYVVRDISQQKMLMKKLDDAITAAKSSNEAKSYFLANMSHEIRTPLGAIIGFSDLLLEPNLSFSEKSKYSEIIKRNGELLEKIISDILDLSKIDFGKIDIVKRPVNVLDLLNEVREIILPQALVKELAFSNEIGSELPQFIHTDPSRLKQILINIIGNAIKFTDKGSVTVRVRLMKNKANKPLIAFEVEDTGIGIEDEFLKSLFMPFAQANSKMREKVHGTGLGMAISKRLAELLGGELVLSKTQLNRGSVFTITIDPGDVDGVQSDLDQDKLGPAQIELPVKLDKVRILLVEDAEDNQILIRRMLTVAGAVVDIANNGLEGIEKIAANPNYDVVLMDLRMPILDGYEATAQLREMGCEVPIIALTAHAIAGEREKCLNLGFSEYVTKPIGRNILFQKIRECLAS